MIQDPGDELFSAVRRAGDDPTDADRRAVALVQRRFGLALPPPFAILPAGDEKIPVRSATAADGAAIAGVRWRSWQVSYRGLIPAEVLADFPTRTPIASWIADATVPASTRHQLLVAGRPGVVLAMAQVRPTHDRDQDPAEVAEIDKLYLDPLVRRRGIGGLMLEEAVLRARAAGAARFSLWVATGNAPARAFYEAAGWWSDGATDAMDLGGGVTLEETRYWLDPPA